MGFVNIVNTNSFFYSNEKLSQSYAHMDSQGATLNTQNVITGEGYKLLRHTFFEGAGFLGG